MSRLYPKRPVHFVLPTDPTNEETSTCRESKETEREDVANGLDGNHIKEFYEDLVGDSLSEQTQSPSTSSSGTNIVPRKKPRKAPDIGRMKVTHRSIHAYLKAAQEGDIKTLQSLLAQGVSVDCTDSYGWTGLMCAVKAEEEAAVKFLLQAGADTEAVDSKGNSVKNIAKNCKARSIQELIENKGVCQIDETKTTVKELFYCDVCKEQFSNKCKHETSTLHLFNNKGHIRKGTVYSLPESNKGFQLMLKSGWDKDRGLGAEGQGRKFPLKTLLKRDRQGLGVETDAKPRVTHFGPKDKQAIESPRQRTTDSTTRTMRQATKSKYDRVKKLNRDQQKERNFRMEFQME